ncbi:lyase family protein [Tropicibacter naphthalenivorans]|uniref:3-carboxy-cis,cis-muconate cycloisomerase n=1 Tax=Tropicibacter naphthalenivorans TaxID=441103 RepID=A0A0P1G0D7_9RHOB|nr:lyase family protein [Tropicibacter naphthalenivorans]CUH75165.1 3-carboxy-cis,cis-muconate cycloisomerase [Tropicibacter naphthalenivorans]SMC45806.1 3-carboxy-cis,cis-muconate cycloisomerase [Tropicibacter naphthalenivorans]
MPATPFDSAHLTQLFATGDTARLFSDTAEIRAMMMIEGALAQVQAAHGVIPETAAKAIHRAGLEIQIDPSGLAEATGQNGVSTPALVAAFRKEMQAPEHAQYLHWGATSQDIQDTALMLRLRQVIAQQETRLKAILGGLASLAEEHADTPMAARTYGQHATPSSFGAQVAQWGHPLLRALNDAASVRENLWVSLSGAAGTGSALGPDPAAIRAGLAEKLALSDPGRSWHTDRAPVLAILGWLVQMTLATGKMGEDLILATQSGIGEVILGGTGASSTMPQKQNPVGPSALVALGHHVQGLFATLQGAALHRQQRDGAAWFTEWLTLPQLVLSSAAALTHAETLATSLRPNPAAMQTTLDSTGGLLMAEALTFELAKTIPRPDAQASVKTLCAQARDTGTPLADIARAAHPDLPGDFFDTARSMGAAPSEARTFAAAVRAVI